ncbi:hypothetical protein PENSPDRAFT_760334 [Peniophora sp. CONT]|nr:hypothetical protein PENSPDRAFT_760334 [Peniophora sp. CONT]
MSSSATGQELVQDSDIELTWLHRRSGNVTAEVDNIVDEAVEYGLEAGTVPWTLRMPACDTSGLSSPRYGRTESPPLYPHLSIGLSSTDQNDTSEHSLLGVGWTEILATAAIVIANTLKLMMIVRLCEDVDAVADRPVASSPTALDVNDPSPIRISSSATLQFDADGEDSRRLRHRAPTGPQDEASVICASSSYIGYDVERNQGTKDLPSYLIDQDEDPAGPSESSPSWVEPASSAIPSPEPIVDHAVRPHAGLPIQPPTTFHAKVRGYAHSAWATWCDFFGSRLTYYHELRDSESAEALQTVQKQIQDEWNTTLTFLFVLAAIDATVFGYAIKDTLYIENSIALLCFSISAATTAIGIIIDGYMLFRYRGISVDTFEVRARNSPQPYLYFAIQASLPRSMQFISVIAASLFLLVVAYAKQPIVVGGLPFVVLVIFNLGWFAKIVRRADDRGSGDVTVADGVA